MAYFLNLFTPETWSIFRERGAGVSSFTKGHRSRAHASIKPGDFFVCYLAYTKRWCGVLRIASDAYDDGPIPEDPMPWEVHFKVEPIVILDPEHSIPIENDEIWYTLSITKDIEKGARGWGANIASSLRTINDSDGDFLVSRLKRQQQGDSRIDYPLTDADRRSLTKKLKVPTPSGAVSVEVPVGDEDGDDAAEALVEATVPSETRKSIQMQAKIAEMGAKMGFQVWVPRNDKERVLANVSDGMKPRFLENLPLNYDDTTLRTIEQIDVIWLKGRSMARAFEVEHTTAVYSGLLRMADLLALQPNMDIRLHIVAADEKREKVLREIKRPVFSLLERGPLYKNCSFLSYDALEELGNKPHLEHTHDSIIEEYEEHAEDY